MRVLHCISSLDLGGSQRQLALLSRELPRHGWDVHIATLTGGNLAQTLDPATTVHLIESSRERDVRVPLRFARLIGQLQPAIVQTWLLKMDILAGVAALARGVPWIATERNSALGYPPHWSTRVRAWLVPRADALVANSVGGLEMWSDGRGPRKRWLIRNGFAALGERAVGDGAVGHDAIAEARLPQGIRAADDSPVIVYAGRFVHEKRLRILIEAFGRARRDVRATLLLCGTGPLETELRRAVSELGLDDVVVFAGFVHDMEAVLRRAAVLVSVSAVEGSPNAVQEAMAYGTPVVLSDIPAHRELADARAACFVHGNDAEAVASGLVDCIRHPLEARARADAAQSIAHAWSAAAMASEYDAVYRHVLDARRHRWRSPTS